jgi:hypothetical protein
MLSLAFIGDEDVEERLQYSDHGSSSGGTTPTDHASRTAAAAKPGQTSSPGGPKNPTNKTRNSTATNATQRMSMMSERGGRGGKASGGGDSSAVEDDDGGVADEEDASSDLAAALVGLLSLISAASCYNDQFGHFAFLYAGTFVAHLFGGLAHLSHHHQSGAYGVRGSDFFYTCRTIGAVGHCLRYGFGWGTLDADEEEIPSLRFDVASLTAWIAVINTLYLSVAGLLVMRQMRRSTNNQDEQRREGTEYTVGPVVAPVTSDLTTTGETVAERADVWLGRGENCTAVMENVSALSYLFLHRGSLGLEGWNFCIAGVMINMLGWIGLNIVAFLVWTRVLSAAQTHNNKHPRLLKRVFHYCMIIMLWAVDMFVRTRITVAAEMEQANEDEA